MEAYAQIVDTLALTLGVAWASGLNLYAALLMLGYMHASGAATLPPDLVILADPVVMLAAGFMYLVEFFADKTPGVDTGWDALHSFIRVPAGAVLAAAAVGEVALPLQLATAIVGGGVAAATHATKAGSRVLINTSPEPFSNWAASIAEDIAVFGGLWMALHNPWLFLVLLIAFLLLLVWLLPRLWRAIVHVYRFLVSKLRGQPAPPRPEDIHLLTANLNRPRE